MCHLSICLNASSKISSPSLPPSAICPDLTARHSWFGVSLLWARVGQTLHSLRANVSSPFRQGILSHISSLFSLRSQPPMQTLWNLSKIVLRTPYVLYIHVHNPISYGIYERLLLVRFITLLAGRRREGRRVEELARLLTSCWAGHWWASSLSLTFWSSTACLVHFKFEKYHNYSSGIDAALSNVEGVPEPLQGKSFESS